MITEFSELQALDFAVGGYIADVFSCYAKTGPKGWQDFLERPVNKKIYRHRTDDSGSFIRDFVNSESNRSETGISPTEFEIRNYVPLPLIQYYRKSSLSISDEYLINHIEERRTYNDGLDQGITIEIIPILVTYFVRFMAWDDLTLDKMILAWVRRMIGTKAGKHKFAVPYTLGDEPAVTKAFIRDSKKCIFDDVSPQGLGRVAAAETTIEVEAMVVFGADTVIIDPVKVIGRIGRLIP